MSNKNQSDSLKMEAYNQNTVSRYLEQFNHRRSDSNLSKSIKMNTMPYRQENEMQSSSNALSKIVPSNKLLPMQISKGFDNTVNRSGMTSFYTQG